MLKDCVAARAAVGVTWAETELSFSSIILKVETGEHYLLLDELHPKSGHALLTKDTDIVIRGRVSGAKFSFECPVIEIGGQSGVAFYRVPLPTIVRYQQRRVDYRVDLGVSRHISVYFSEVDGRIVHGDIADLSCSGLRARVKPATLSLLMRGMRLPACTLRLPENVTVSSEAEICHVESHGPTTTASIGARFLDLGTKEERQITRFMKKVEREHLRRRPEAR